MNIKLNFSCFLYYSTQSIKEEEPEDPNLVEWRGGDKAIH
jgi:hypothetical protein